MGETDNQPTGWSLHLGIMRDTCSKCGEAQGRDWQYLFSSRGMLIFPVRSQKPELSIWLIAVKWPYVHNVVAVIQAFRKALLDIVLWGPCTLWRNLSKCVDGEVVTQRGWTTWVRVNRYWAVPQVPGFLASRPVFFLWPSSQRTGPSFPKAYVVVHYFPGMLFVLCKRRFHFEISWISSHSSAWSSQVTSEETSLGSHSLLLCTLSALCTSHIKHVIQFVICCLCHS